MLVIATTRVFRETDQRKLAKYGCDRCGYAPRPQDLDENQSFPCPGCGRPLYPD
jgi:rubrerythrin